ncbi:DUF261 family protein (plasmid) [Borrelia miyamotoi]|uniref:DUF261 family protein n=6 Tax=Borrelia miyamotoi TaxID=47466 RepID=A0AAQ3CPS4_9SPIR|nr:DUF261 family protein [Borrelia miyamotoi]MBW6184760.1 DUF261 domain-containing protein [Pseudomonas aeruginosa]AHH06049.1 Hypothetical protein BOM_1506 [Borrelia miyamotoi FR64b]ATQ15469.1 DUF261 family protein [Borrelia miyamotoi]ATQ17882.1 DUF261 family protein [Borrelia miyamotoi]ATQ19120.1 DUF261 family protein [Borrelia miyamotoi]
MLRNSFFVFIYDCAYKALKEYFIRKYKSELLESASYSKVCEKIREVEKHRLVVPFQYNFADQNVTICKFGCYFLCILFISFVVKEIKDRIEKCFDKFEVDLLFKSIASIGGLKDANSYVLDPNLILRSLGINSDLHYLSVHYSPDDYKPESCDILIGKYRDIGSGLYHFVIVDNDLKSVIWDSLGSSKAVSDGELESLRVFKIVDRSLVSDIRDRLALYREQFNSSKKNNLESLR